MKVRLRPPNLTPLSTFINFKILMPGRKRRTISYDEEKLYPIFPEISENTI